MNKLLFTKFHVRTWTPSRVSNYFFALNILKIIRNDLTQPFMIPNANPVANPPVKGIPRFPLMTEI